MVMQWNPDVTMYQWTGKITSLYRVSLWKKETNPRYNDIAEKKNTIIVISGYG